MTPILHDCGVFPLVRIKLNNFVYSKIIFSGKNFKYSFRIKSLPPALFNLNLEIALDISSSLNGKFIYYCIHQELLEFQNHFLRYPGYLMRQNTQQIPPN